MKNDLTKLEKTGAFTEFDLYSDEVNFEEGDNETIKLYIWIERTFNDETFTGRGGDISEGLQFMLIPVAGMAKQFCNVLWRRN